MNKPVRLDIDRIARDAAKPVSDYKLDPSDLPFVPGLWNIVIEPLAPKKVSSGGIELPNETQEAQEILTAIGQIIAVGPLAFEGMTESGMDTSKCVYDPETKDVRAYQVGDWVGYMRYTGHQMTLSRDLTKSQRPKSLLILTVSELLGLVKRPRDFQIYV